MEYFKSYLSENIDLIDDEYFNDNQLSDLKLLVDGWFQTHQKPLEIETFFKEKYTDFGLTIDCLITWNICITIITQSLSQEKLSNQNLDQIGYFSCLMVHLTNNLFAVKHLLELGYDTQAKGIYRNSIEISDLALCVLHSKEFFDNHKKPNPKKSGNPYISPKNKTVETTAEVIIKEILKELEGRFKTNNVLSLHWKTVRKDHYSTLSESAHGNYLHNMTNAYKLVDKERVEPSTGGGKWYGLEDSLSDLCLHHLASKRFLTFSLKLKHNIDLFDNSNLYHKMIYYLDTIIGKKLIQALIKPKIK